MWNDLSILDKSRIMLLAVLNGITSLSKIQLLYDSSLSLLNNTISTIPNSDINTFSSGGKIQIKPENRGKFTALKERTGHSATWFKQHGTPALKKMAVFALNSRKWKHDDGGYINRYDDGSLLKDNLITAASKILNPIGSKHDSFWHTVDVLGAPSHVTNAIRDIGNRIASYPAIIADAAYNHYANNLNWVEAIQEAETNPSTLASLFQVHPIENNENNYSLEELALMYELTRPRKGKKEGGINALDYRQINYKKGEGNKYAAAITKDNFFDPNKVIEWSVGGMSGLTDENGLPISFDRFAYDIADTYGVYGNPNTWDSLVKPLRFAVGLIGSKGFPNRKDSKTSIVTKVPVAALKAAYDKLNNQRSNGGYINRYDDGSNLTLADVQDYFWRGDKEGYEKAMLLYRLLLNTPVLNRQLINNSVPPEVKLPEIVVTPNYLLPNWTSEDINNPVYKKTPKIIHYNDYQGWLSELAAQKDPLGKIAGIAIGLPLIASSPVVPALLEGSLNGVKEIFKAMDFLYSPSKWLNPVTGNKLLSPVLGTSADALVQSAFVTEGLKGLYDLYKNGTLSNYGETAQNALMTLPIVGPAVSLAVNGIRYATPYLQAMQRGVRNKLGSRQIADTPWLFTDISDINPYENLNFYRLIEGLPIIKDGKVLLGKEGLGFVNFTTDLPFRLHKKYDHIPGGELMIINGGKLQGKTPISIEPMDSFFLNDIQLNPNLITIATGNKDLLKQGKKLGFNMITSEELLKNYPKEQTRINKLTKTGFGYRAGAKLYKQLLDEFVTKTFGRPTLSDYKILEDKTGLKAGVEKYTNLLDEISKLNSIFETTPASQLPTHYVYTLPNKRELGVRDIMYPAYRDLLNYKDVFYDPVTSIESKLTKKLSFPPHPKNSEELVKAFKDYIKTNSINPLSTGGPLYPFSFSKIPYIKTPIVRY